MSIFKGETSKGLPPVKERVLFGEQTQYNLQACLRIEGQLFITGRHMHHALLVTAEKNISQYKTLQEK